MNHASKTRLRHEDGDQQEQGSDPIRPEAPDLPKIPASTSPDAPTSSAPKVDQNLRTLLDIDLLYAAVGLDPPKGSRRHVQAISLPAGSLRETKPLVISKDQVGGLIGLLGVLRQTSNGLSMAVEGGATVQLPQPVVALLCSLIEGALKEQSAVVTTVRDPLSIEDAAAILRRRPSSVERLIADGEIEIVMGNHRRLPLKSVLDYLKKTKQRNQLALSQMSAMAEEFVSDAVDD